MFNVLIVVTLRQEAALDFFVYLNICLSMLRQKLLRTQLHVNSLACIFLIADPAFFIGMPDFFYKYNLVLRVKCQLGGSSLLGSLDRDTRNFITAQYFSQFSGFHE